MKSSYGINPGLTGLHDKGAEKKRILIIVPAYNEQGNIEKTIDEIVSLKMDLSIVVINDSSTDETEKKARAKGVAVICLPYNLGIGGAVQTGFQYARDHGYDIAVQVDGDAQHDVSFLNDLTGPVISGEYDMTIGSRFIPPFLGYRSSFVRRIGINFFAHLIGFITQYKVTDPTSGFRAFNKKMINVFAQNYPTDYPEPEAIVVAGRHRARIKEIPVAMRKRPAGFSSIRYLKTLYYMVKVTFAVLLARIK